MSPLIIALEFTTFIGRFHPVMVHLPIGFLVLAIVLEWVDSFRKTDTKNGFISTAWFLAGIGAAVAALCGWYLGETGLYEEDMLFVHRWLGIALIAVSFVGWWLKRGGQKFSPLVQNGFNILVLGMLFYEGHQGGNLTHGETYLTEFAPESLQNILGPKKEKDSLPEFSNPDSVLLYADLVAPIFEAKCVACHNNEVQRGGLNMASADSLLMGSNGDPIVVRGNPQASELFRRITLPQTNIKFMPPTQDPLTYDEIKVVEWWISTGASVDETVSAVEVSESIKPVLLRRYDFDVEPKPWYETVRLAPLESTQIEELRKAGFEIRTLGPENPLLDVSYSQKDLTEAHIQKLEVAKEHITWLSLGGSNVRDEWLDRIGKFPNLTRLELEKTGISDEGVALLAPLKHLEVLNLYNTQITDAGLAEIEKINGLKRVYLWGTEVTAEMTKQAQEKNENLEIVVMYP